MTDAPGAPEAGWHLTVDSTCDGWRLDQFIAHRVPRLSRARAARLDAIDLDDPTRRLKKGSTVREGQRLFARRPMPDADAQPPAPMLLYADDDLMVLDKPAGLATHPTASRFKQTVTYWLAVHAGDGRPAEPAHRIDVETSGVLVCGRHALANRALKIAFASREISKTYLAVVEGLPAIDTWTNSTPLGFDASSAVRLKMGEGGSAAQTAFRVVRRGRHRALVEARPITGRQHQIRVHLSQDGHPIVGDKLYGPDEQIFLACLDRSPTGEELALLGHPRHALHALSVEFLWKGCQRRFEAPVPEAFEALLFD